MLAAGGPCGFGLDPSAIAAVDGGGGSFATVDGCAGGRFMGGVRGAIVAVEWLAEAVAGLAEATDSSSPSPSFRRFAFKSFSELSKSDKNAKKSSIFET